MSKGIRILIVMVVLVCLGRGAFATTVYWTDKSDNTIRRLDLNGGPIEPLIIPADGLGEARGIALDTFAGKMYWADNTNGKIQRANLDGSNIQDLVTDLTSLGDVELDLTAKKIYWTNVVSKLKTTQPLCGHEVDPRSRKRIQ